VHKKGEWTNLKFCLSIRSFRSVQPEDIDQATPSESFHTLVFVEEERRVNEFSRHLVEGRRVYEILIKVA
jgi:hypothetical protein